MIYHFHIFLRQHQKHANSTLCPAGLVTQNLTDIEFTCRTGFHTYLRYLVNDGKIIFDLKGFPFLDQRMCWLIPHVHQLLKKNLLGPYKQQQVTLTLFRLRSYKYDIDLLSLGLIFSISVNFGCALCKNKRERSLLLKH